MSGYMDVVHVHERVAQDGTKKSQWTKVGIYFPPKSEKTGGEIRINEGVSVTGKLVLMPQKDRNEGP